MMLTAEVFTCLKACSCCMSQVDSVMLTAEVFTCLKACCMPQVDSVMLTPEMTPVAMCTDVIITSVHINSEVVCNVYRCDCP